MTDSATCDWMDLEAGFGALLDGLGPEMGNQVEKAVTKVTRKGARLLRAEAAKRWKGKTGSRYAAGFSSRVKRAGAATSGEIGNKNMPGLVHLLEKGHATMGGSRSKAYPHLAPVYDEIAPEAFDEVSEAAGRALEG